MNLLAKVELNELIRTHENDYYYKSFKMRTHIFTMLFGILNRCDSMTEVCDGLRKKNHKFFEDLYFTLVKHYHSFLSDNRTFELTFKEVLIIDSTTIRLFSDILKGIGVFWLNSIEKNVKICL